MGDARVAKTPRSWTSTFSEIEPYHGPPRNVAWIDAINFDKSLQPKNYEIAGTDPESKILFLDVNILDSTGNEPYSGDVLIEGMFCIPPFTPILLNIQPPDIKQTQQLTSQLTNTIELK